MNKTDYYTLVIVCVVMAFWVAVAFTHFAPNVPGILVTLGCVGAGAWPLIQAASQREKE